MKLVSKIALTLVVLAGFSVARADASVDFFRAINIDDARAVNQLLARGLDPNSTSSRGLPALVQAVRDESPKVLDALLAQPGLQVDATTPANETALMMAALAGQPDWVRKLLARGAKINREGWTPLHYAASGPEPQLLTLLLDQGAAINAPAPNRTTPLMMAARYGNEDGAYVLLARGADPKLRNDLGLSAADFARTGGREALAAKLEQAAR